MATRRDRIVRLTSTPREMEAGLLVAALEQNGIKATMTGELTAGFRAEAPGWVQVLVLERDLLRAQAVLHEVAEQGDDIDWSQVDIGEPDETPLSEAMPFWTNLSLWRRVAYVVVMITLVWVVAGFAAELAGAFLRVIGLGSE